MNIPDATRVLAKCALYDNRKAGKFEIQAWAECIPDNVELEDALTAVSAWYRDHTERIMPANVISGARKAWAKRHHVPAYEGD